MHVKSAGMQRIASRFNAIPILLVSILLTSVTTHAEPQALTIDQAVNTALARNPATQKTRQRLEQTDSQIARTYSMLFPSITATTAFTHRKDSLNTAAPLFGGEPYNHYTLGVQAQQPLYQGGALTSAISAAKEEREIARIDSDIAKRDLSQRVIQAFYTILMDRVKLESLERIRKVEEQQLQTAEAHRRIGRGQLLDVLQIKTQLALLKPQIDQARNQIQISAMELATLIGAADAESITVTGSLDPLPWDQIEALTKEKPRNNPEKIKLEHQVSLLDSQNQTLLSKHWPQLNAVATWGRAAFVKSDLFDEDATGWTLGLQANIPLFSGLSSIYERRSLASQKTQLESDQSIVQQQIHLERLRTQRELQRSLKQIESSREAFQLAEEAMKEAQKDYSRSLITYQTLLASQQSRLEADIAHHQAKYETLLNLTRYYVAWGQDLQVLVQLLGARS